MVAGGPCAALWHHPALFEAGRRMVEDQGAEAVVLAGTDLNLAFTGHDPGYPAVDALDVHVAVLAGLAMGARTLDAPSLDAPSHGEG